MYLVIGLPFAGILLRGFVSILTLLVFNERSFNGRSRRWWQEMIPGPDLDERFLEEVCW
jgi:hypothetical protein